MIFRESTLADIPQIQIVRNAVKENRLSDPSLVSDKDVEEFISKRGKGWICTDNNIVIGFAIADLVDNNIWALFVHPDHEGRSVGKKLQELMLDWYYSQGKENVWLSTGPGTRAEKFYRKSGWKETGFTAKGEIKFEMTATEWKATKQNK